MKEIAVTPGAATIRHTIPMPEDSPLRVGKAESVALGSPVPSTVQCWWAYTYRTANFQMGGQPIGGDLADMLCADSAT